MPDERLNDAIRQLGRRLLRRRRADELNADDEIDGILTAIATNAIDRLHTTATSHDRTILVETMGHKTGWLALGSGIAGGADVILLPEIPYDIESVAEFDGQFVANVRVVARSCRDRIDDLYLLGDRPVHP